MNSLLRFSFTALTLALTASLPAQNIPPKPKPEEKASKEVTGHVLILEKLPPPSLDALTVPRGFQIQRFAENLGNARMLAVGPNGNVYVTRREQGDVLMFKVGTDGLAAGGPVRVASRPGMHGIAFHENHVFLVTVHEVFRAEVSPDGSFGLLEMIIHDLPDAGQHATRTVAVGPDNMLYIGVGSTTNEAVEPNPESATLLRASLDGKSRAIFASGLRDVVGWGWHPQTGELWAMDHGIDWLGDDEQNEELNLIEKGKRYGWPYFYGDNQANPNRVPPDGITREEMKKASVPMVMGYTAHASPMQLSFYNAGQFPAEYRGDAFISMRGSWNRKPASGYEILRIRFRDGRPVAFEPFVTGFLTRRGESGRLAGNAIAADGSLLFTDDRNGVIYRISHTSGVGSPAVASRIPDGPMLTQSRAGMNEPIASDMRELHTEQRLQVSSPAFADGQPIPVMYSAYDQNFSPPLQWSAGPAGTKSYVLLMEDPDASITPLPVVHWVAWNIPAGTQELREGVPPMEGLDDPKGMRQGANTMGRPGYMGSKPPAGDPPHHYFYQVFALDRTLELLPGAGRQEVLAAAKGHVLAVGRIHGTFRRPDNPKRP